MKCGRAAIGRNELNEMISKHFQSAFAFEEIKVSYKYGSRNRCVCKVLFTCYRANSL